MIDLSNKLRGPGWGRVVAELARPAPDDQSFFSRLVSVLHQVSGARQAVLFSVPNEEEGEPRALVVWPPAGSGQLTSVEGEPEARGAARSAASTGRMAVFGLESGESPYYEASNQGYVAALPLPASAPGQPTPPGPRQVVTLLLDHRSSQALAATLAMGEVLVGYVYVHGATRALGRLRQAGAALDLAARLIASINTAPNFKGACMQMVNDLMRALQVDRAALGWRHGLGVRGEGETIRVRAISDTEQIDKRLAMVRKIRDAMEECLDQRQAVMFPAPPERVGPGGEPGDMVLAHAITHAHRELAAGDAKLKVASVPLRIDDDVVGVVTIETATDAPPDPGVVELLQAAMDLVAPVLRIRKSDDRNVALRSWDAALKTAGWAVGPKHTVWKLVGVLVFALAVTVTFVKAPYRVEAPVTLEPRVRRTVSVPFDGIIAHVPEGIKPGERVEGGQVLVELDTSELELTAIEAEGERLKALKQADAAQLSGKMSESQQAMAQAHQAEARIKLLRSRIEKASIRAPIAGTIIAGDVEDREGASVKLGDALFEIAPLDDMLVVAKVDDRDIALVSGAEGGSFASKAYPGRHFGLEIERVVPLARAEQGKNTFEVRARLEETADWMRPGMEGLAKFDTGDRTLFEIGTRRIVDTLRLWFWW